MSTRLPVGKGSRTRTARLLRAIAADLRSVAAGLDFEAQNLVEGSDTGETARMIDATVSRGHHFLGLWPRRNRALNMVNKGGTVRRSEVN